MIVPTTEKQKELLRNLQSRINEAQTHFSVAASAIIAGVTSVPDGAAVELLPDGTLSVADGAVEEE